MNTHMELPEIAWYLIQCKPRHDEQAWEHLNRQGFECFCPHIRKETIRAGKVRKISQPLFPGYIFIHLKAQDNWVKLRSTRGVSKVVGFCGRPCRIDDEIIERLKQRTAQEPETKALNPGDKVQIKTGPLADMDAIFLAMDGEQRVMLLLSILNREQHVRLPLSHLSALRA
ncbi:transcription/translation regulatory transformer protein RfaH [Phytopseudomonas dryadis]|uniref:Transcription/translation regulatory transformer protein RfaH n=1 Tax=Phytopseudomonas dryadis TaxID=2487520 RepID=A0A4V2KBI8_9GAMM|nr:MULTISPECIES: transcription/translation regulatory transformer protein RfaH [Pseudomonas]TBU86713.1 transcription/translation regulatory transformer protein RfaH [Pseudomonas dryadis]TBV05426.1 transcription/translation regulatory transformer protein RfaH [Pseudomonas dryadis]TBV18435.1 transcription/translation regulatory transformer protein RfaH [Pseudomonas sp. FRB 230]